MSSISAKSINTVRCLAIDMVQAANSGHPGAPMGCAPMAYALWAKLMKYNPKKSDWFSRDRFVLSNGHACALQYAMLHVTGYDVTLEDMQNFRQLGSRTPGHPENHMTDGIEVTTGPLGQGISNAVGLALGQAHMAARFNKPEFPVVDNYTYCIVGDGCLQEGVASEAASLAGHLGLGRLIVLYDDNKITIDGSTDVSFTEDVLARFEAYGWHTSTVADGDNDIDGIVAAVEAAKAVTDRPSIIKIRTTIGYGSVVANTAKAHGAPLGDAEAAAVKTKFGLDADKTFFVPEDVATHFAEAAAAAAASYDKWVELLAAYEAKFPEDAAELKRRIAGELPADWTSVLPTYTPEDKANATRKLSQAVLQAVCDKIPDVIGGSADLTGSNGTQLKNMGELQKTSYDGRYIRFGVREHGMAAICNGLVAYGGFVPFCATFLNFVGYCQPSIRLAALSKLRQLFIMTHDSIGLGEDGPTHQPVEILALLRATPNLMTMRPADGNETSACYKVALEAKETPSVLALTRQNLPHLAGSSIEKASKGGYTLVDTDGQPDVIVVATGSEVHVAVEAAAKVSGKKVRVVSMPITEVFDAQPAEYRKSVLIPGVPTLSVEAATTFGWAKYATECVGVDTFGVSAKGADAFKHFGITVDAIADKIAQM